MLERIEFISENLEQLEVNLNKIEEEIDQEIQKLEWKLTPVEWKLLAGKKDHAIKLRQRIEMVIEERNKTKYSGLKSHYDRLIADLKLKVSELQN